MLTPSQIAKVEKMERAYSLGDGACFGVMFPSSLRPTSPSSNIVRSQTDKFVEGKKYRSRPTHKESLTFMNIHLLDIELVNGYRARVATRIGGNLEAVEEYVKDKTPFCFLESRNIGYIVETFD